MRANRNSNNRGGARVHANANRAGRIKKTLRKLGPGLITGAADDDPSGIASYSQGGAQFGFGTLWTLFFTYPLMVGIQIISAHIGCVTGRGLAANVRLAYPAWFLYALVGLLLAANVINIGADLSAMANAAELVTDVPSQFFAVSFGVLSLLLQIFLPYARYVRLLKWLTLALLAYVAVLFVVRVPWGAVLSSVIFPRWIAGADYVAIIVAIFGTTISPYLFFWQAALEVEEQRADVNGKRPVRRHPGRAPAQFRRIKIDTYIGMAFSNLIAFFIMVCAAVTLHEGGVRDISTAAEAAQALRPIAGDFAFLLFALGIIGTGLLALPVLAGSAAYAVAEAMRWPAGLGLKPASGKGFYAIIAFSTLLGVTLDFSGIAPMKALVWSAIINGVISVPMMAVTMHMASGRRLMGRFVISPRLKWLGWIATAVMGAVVMLLGWSLLKG